MSKNTIEIQIKRHPNQKVFKICKSESEVDQFITNCRKGIIIFYAEWCKHCHSLISRLLKILDNNVAVHDNTIALVEERVSMKSIKYKSKVDGYPTVYEISSQSMKQTAIPLQRAHSNPVQDQLVPFIGIKSPSPVLTETKSVEPMKENDFIISLPPNETSLPNDIQQLLDSLGEFSCKYKVYTKDQRTNINDPILQFIDNNNKMVVYIGWSEIKSILLILKNLLTRIESKS